MPRELVRIAVDAVGGDEAPATVLQGVEDALQKDGGLHVLLVGPAEVTEPFAAGRERCEARPASEIIAMDEHPAGAVRSRKDSSIVVGCRLVKDGEAEAFFSAGNTGAAMAAATLVMGRLPGVLRPAIGTVIPTTRTPCVLLDAGANADAKPEHLVQFAHMGAAYATTAIGIRDPRVGLLNIGSEPTKGSILTQEAFALMQAEVPGFIGNVEGDDVPYGAADVVVTDGFTGNVALKLMEGLSRALLDQVKDALLANPVTKVAALALRPSMGALRNKLDPDAHGGAPLLGVDGVCIIGHGSSGPSAVAAALRVGASAIRGGLTQGIVTALAATNRDTVS